MFRCGIRGEPGSSPLIMTESDRGECVLTSSTRWGGDVRAQSEKLAEEVLAEHWPEATFPVDPVRIARRMGLEVFSAELGNDTFGLIVGTPGSAEIFVDKDQPPNRWRFTVAHELGHFVDHAAREGDHDLAFIDRRSDDNPWSKDEVYANHFGGALLMPRGQVQDLVDQGVNEVRMASIFGVSLSALRYRLQLLELGA